jgi:uncharacterized circularly permuted ATP-grasp superfamily protein
LPSEALYGSAPAVRLPGGTYDPDRLLAGYPAARTQEPLFDVAGGRAGFAAYDEFVDAAGNVRPGWRELAEIVGERGHAGLDRLRANVSALVDQDGITYIAVDQSERTTERNGRTARNGHTAGCPTPWQLDALPLLVSPGDWAKLESGLVQRSRLLAAVLADLYGPRRCVTGGVLPPALLFAHPGYLRAASAIEIPGHYQLFMHGCDISRNRAGCFLVNADWTQAPSGAGYVLADRRVVAHAAPDLYERVGPRPASPFAQTLRLALIDAAPEAAEDPTVVVLTPGIHSENAFDQAYLASVLGFPLVESADLVVRDGKLWMRSLGTLKRVDVVLRRVDADYADPLDLRPDSKLGVVGLVEVLRRGAVTAVNTLGSGILESPGLMRFLPERNLGVVSVATVAELVLFEAENPRSLAYQLERLRADLRALPGASGSSRAERLVDEIGTRLRRLDPADLDRVGADGRRAELAALLSGMHDGLLELADVITSTQLSLPGEMQPLWGPDLRRVVP